MSLQEQLAEWRCRSSEFFYAFWAGEDQSSFREARQRALSVGGFTVNLGGSFLGGEGKWAAMLGSMLGLEMVLGVKTTYTIFMGKTSFSKDFLSKFEKMLGRKGVKIKQAMSVNCIRFEESNDHSKSSPRKEM